MDVAELKRAVLADLENEELLEKLARAVDREGGIEGRLIADWVSDFADPEARERAEETLAEHALEATLPLVKAAQKRRELPSIVRCLVRSPSPLAFGPLIQALGNIHDEFGELAAARLFSPECLPRALPRMIAFLARRRGEAPIFEINFRLGRVPLDPILPGLRAAASDPEAAIRGAVCKPLGHHRAPEATELLIALSADPEEDVRKAAYRALQCRASLALKSRDRDPESFAATLLERLEEADDDERGDIYLALAAAEGEEVIAALCAGLRADDEELRWAAVRALAGAAPDRLCELVLEAAGEGHATLIEPLLDVLEEPAPVVEALLSGADPALRQAAVEGLDQVEEELMLDVVASVSRSQDPAIRAQALRRLARFDEVDCEEEDDEDYAQVFALLKSGLEDEALSVRGAAAEVLGLQTSLPFMILPLRRAFHAVTIPAAGDRADPELLEAFRHLACALGKLDPEGGPILWQSLRAADRHRAFRVAAVVGLTARVDLWDAEAKELVIAPFRPLLDHKDPVMREAAALACFECEDWWAVPKLAALLEDPDEAVREQAAVFFREQEIDEQEPDPEDSEFNAAQQAYRRYLASKSSQ